MPGQCWHADQSDGRGKCSGYVVITAKWPICHPIMQTLMRTHTDTHTHVEVFPFKAAFGVHNAV